MDTPRKLAWFWQAKEALVQNILAEYPASNHEGWTVRVNIAAKKFRYYFIHPNYGVVRSVPELTALLTNEPVRRQGKAMGKRKR
ncbi:hypothetical protein WJX72_003358 [[Myrmecia] bisecta]|uniref:Uncharacterized protein n=1 Tax=[Myrmecia] bisecta TaxID=41462 RepID=A0AAW1QPZ2_9CHLO